MKRFLLTTLIFVACIAPAAAQYGAYGWPYGQQPYRQAQRTVDGWYQRFLGRQPDPHAAGWVQALESGQDPERVLAGILGSDEYYLRQGGTPTGFVQGLYRDLARRQPNSREQSYWTNQIYFVPRTDIAYSLLTRLAQNWDWDGRDRPWEDRYDYRRPYWPYR